MDKKIEQYLDGHDVTLRLESTSELVAIHSDDERIYVMKESYHALASALLSMNVEDKEQDMKEAIGTIGLFAMQGENAMSVYEKIKERFIIIKKPQ